MAGIRLNIARFLERTASEGPGWRAAIWVQGCSILCPGCCNPGYLAQVDRRWVPVDDLVDRILAVHDIEGVTFLGGEPFDQSEAVGYIATRVRERGLSVLTFTGYRLEELRKRSDAGTQSLLAATDLLIDGPFIQELYTTDRLWIGSDNQRLLFLTDRYADVEARLTPSQTNTVEIRISGNEIAINGFAFTDMVEGLEESLKKQGLTLRPSRPSRAD